MHLYVWRGRDVMTSYSSGIAFALADSVDQARMLVRKQWDLELGWTISWYDPEDPYDRAAIEDRLGWIRREPEVFTEPTGFIKQGGE